GDFVLCDPRAYTRRAPTPGEIVLAADPRAPRRTVIKRVREVLPDGRVVLRGDNPAASTDSRRFGPVPLEAVHARVVCHLGRS
ncbi:MAG: S26 family signal peptidase, partial [Planctomycetota bacterium]